jgi:predicted ATPase
MSSRRRYQGTARCWRRTRSRPARRRLISQSWSCSITISASKRTTTLQLARGKVTARLAALDPTLDDISPYLFALLRIQDTPDPLAQLDPAIKRRRTLDALKRIVLRESLNQPLVVIFEDLHWIDTQTQALLDLLADSIANARVLLLVNYRPEYRHQWANKSYYTQLGLNPLGRESAEELLAALLGDAVELGPLKRLVADKSSGNPFFIEERRCPESC